ncbi:hypothetical protein RB653_008811 [Dictyostelium firmibasis]|uniref:Uncharacterized protein n=1 Tax=Dictyostelium firmibasis TaxID=79012 RepID=A0AAN7TZU3_9MYCE
MCGVCVYLKYQLIFYPK